MKKGTRYWGVEGRLWSEENPDAYAGVHNYDGVLVVFDEASGIADAIWAVTSGFFTENTPNRFWLAFSNPRRNTGYFYEAFNSKRAFWKTKVVDARTVEGTDKQVYERIIQEYGPDSSQAHVEVYGMFPSAGDDQFIGSDIVDEAMGREKYKDLSAPIIIGVDPARYGADATVIAVRQGSPLLIGKGKNETLLASDIPALLPHATQMMILDDGQVADLTAEAVTISTFAGLPVATSFKTIEITAEAVSKGAFDSFMAKEIAEQPQVLERLIASRVRDGRLVQPDLGLELKDIRHIVFLACGTSWHAALLGKRFLEALARVHVEVDISSEYRYRNPVAGGDTLVVAISQSGETADTLAGVRLAKSKFLPVVGLVNVVTSTIAREASGVMPLFAGPEIGVASTKAYTAQVVALYLFALQVAQAKGLLTVEAEFQALAAVKALPAQVAETLRVCENDVKEAADLFAAAEATVFLGRLGEHPTALEGALKLKEIAYVHAIGYPAGEFKHGPIALVTQHLPVICLCPKDVMYEKMLSNLQEVRARSGRVIGVGFVGDTHLRDQCDMVFPMLESQEPLLQPVLSILPLQRYAYHVAMRRDCNVDQPRNLAKSVTVE